MNKTALLTLALFFQFILCISQTEKKTLQNRVNDSITLVHKDMDSLILILRESFYEEDFAKTIQEGEILIDKAKAVDYNKGVYSITSLIGNALLKLNDTTSAVKLFNKELEQAEIRKDSSTFLGASIDLANVYIGQGNSSKAIESYKKVLPYAIKRNDTARKFVLNYNIAELYLDKQALDLADFYVFEADKYIVDLKEKHYHAGFQLLKGRFFYLKNEHKKAILHFTKAIEISKSIKYTEVLIKASTYYASASEKLGNYEEAFRMQKQVDAFKEEKYNKDKIKEVQTVTAKYNNKQLKQDIKRKEFENKLIEQDAARNKNRLMWASIFTLALLLLLLSLFYSYSKRKKLLKDLKEKNAKYLLAKEKSEELANAKSLFFSNISHELRTPLYGIIGLSSILMDDEELHKHKEDVKSLKFSADYLLSLINDVLQISKLDSKEKNNLNKINFNLKDLVNGIMKSFEFLKVQNSNTFNVTICENIPNILIGDDVKLSQILINIIGNACKFTENGKISLKVQAISIENERVQLNFTIKDSGIGIPKSKQQIIFDEFAQVESEAGEYQGTGLGLPIVKKLLEIHKSKIKLISEEGKGTEISFELTYDIAKESYELEQASKLESKITIDNKTILVVDDNRINRIVTRKMLEKYKANPLVAEGGVEAVKLAKANDIDLILMDINMPGMDGLEATDAIRTFNKSVPVIALTAVEIEEMRESIQNSSICDIIIKPYDEMVFVETILRYI